ncbi:MAG TPA: aminoacetone oxidase family FAD-binding enzyme, partial [Chitinophagaceae bacterium]|nr:aminoacetone oxidase family FAD-binding enzyme [Chitinophagaceae bacterium]
MNTQQPTVIIIGGGASGLFCAVNLARQAPHLKVIVLEKTDKLLSKVRISGGGRCNVTHACYDIPTLSSRYPRGQQLMKKTLHWFQPKDTIQWFQERG